MPVSHSLWEPPHFLSFYKKQHGGQRKGGTHGLSMWPRTKQGAVEMGKWTVVGSGKKRLSYMSGPQ